MEKNAEFSIHRMMILVVFTPGVTAFGAAEESDLGFISASNLSEPPLSKVMTAVWTGNGQSWFGSEVFVTVND